MEAGRGGDPIPPTGASEQWRRFLPDGRTRLLGIIGDPIAHSLSPALHTAVLRMLDRNLIYLPFPVSGDRLESFLRTAPLFGVVGLNVTTPFKEAAALAVLPGDEETKRTRMVNAIRFRGGGAFGIGTDGEGILRWLDEAGLGGSPFGLLGFGPTARSLAARSLAQGRPLTRILTRRPEETRSRLDALAPRPPASSGGMPLVCGWGEPGAIGGAGEPRLWVSTLPPDAEMPSQGFWGRGSAESILLDLNYGAGRTGLAEQARSRGWLAAGGLGPLCHQAALSLSFWLEEEVPVSLFRQALGSPERSLRPSR
jgi:shikimate dehydrogenase